MTKDIIKDLTLLTGMPKGKVSCLLGVQKDIFAHSAFEQFARGKESVVIDIDIGNLKISKNKGLMSYEFVPSRVFEKMLKDAYHGKSALTTRTSKELDTRLEGLFKELIS